MMTAEEYNRQYYLRNMKEIKRRTAMYAKTAKGVEVQKRAQQKYRKTAASASAKRRYKQTVKGKLATRRSERNFAAKCRHRRYEESYKGRLSRRKAVKTHRFKSTYGLTLEGYQREVGMRSGKCDICKCVPEKLCVDHCHKTRGAFRGLLCVKCNAGIGMLGDSIVNLRSAIRYLNLYTKKTGKRY